MFEGPIFYTAINSPPEVENLVLIWEVLAPCINKFNCRRVKCVTWKYFTVGNSGGYLPATVYNSGAYVPAITVCNQNL